MGCGVLVVTRLFVGCPYCMNWPFLPFNTLKNDPRSVAASPKTYFHHAFPTGCHPLSTPARRPCSHQAGHDVGDTQVGQHDGGCFQKAVNVLLHNGLVEPGEGDRKKQAGMCRAWVSISWRALPSNLTAWLQTYL